MHFLHPSHNFFSPLSLDKNNSTEQNAANFHSTSDVETSSRLNYRIKKFAMKELKSITSLHPCISILFFLVTIFIYGNWVGGVTYDEYKKIIQDLPAASDLDYYLSALEKAVNFCFKHKNYVDLNMQFGLFMIDVNLKRVLQQEVTSIPAKIKSRLEIIFHKNDVVAEYYQSMVQKHKNMTNYWQYQKLALLFYQANTWLRTDTFNMNLLNETKIYTPELVESIFGKWQSYHKSVYDFEKMKPTPAEIDSCLALLALTDPVDKKASPRPNCLIPYRCKQMMQGGNQFGYGRTHRILLMAIARFSRRCNVISEIRDNSMVDEFCKKCFNEAKFISLNNFLLPDLVYEQITVCGFFGHAQFLRNSWLKGPVQFQTSIGCFVEMIATRDFDENQMREDENEWKIERSLNVMNGKCDVHFTAMAVAALSSALRYIIETYYMYY